MEKTDPTRPCDRCGGFGRIYRNDSIQSSSECDKCGGLGVIPVNMDAIYEQYFNSIDEAHDFHAFISEVESKIIIWAMRKHSLNQGKAAIELKIPRTTLQSKMSVLGIKF